MVSTFLHDYNLFIVKASLKVKANLFRADQVFLLSSSYIVAQLWRLKGTKMYKQMILLNLFHISFVLMINFLKNLLLVVTKQDTK